ncbi:hypothetical protein [Prevotella melaninogenica]|uniref:hypothetical protein n=1 Tax=Prevotella melaninogenica TaxID=28132 RepID=UPI002432C4C0|nr:hypothetical protein [Prevotella melaninogenica]
MTMITDFIDSVLIIDDKKKEIEDLAIKLQEEDISVQKQIIDPQDKKFENIKHLKKYRQLIFMDLSLDDSIDIKNNVSTVIRPILQKILPQTKGCYGLVVWSKHTDNISILKEKLLEDKDKYSLPMFIVPLDKSEYFKKGYDDILGDLNNKLGQEPSAKFFIEWYNSVKTAQDNTISKIYSLIPDYEQRADDFLFILKKIALNYTGIPDNQLNGYPLHIDAFKAFDDILHAELINCQKSGADIFTNPVKGFSKPNDLPNIYAHINAAILIDGNNIDQKTVIPGNVYELKEANSPFKTDKAPEGAKNIVIEITPPCDFSNNGKRVKARLIGGFLINAQKEPKSLKKQIENLKCKKECFYSEIYPVITPEDTVPQILILDFRYFGSEEDTNLKEAKKYKILFRAKPKLFADIIQKFSSHAARLGLSVIHP